MKEKNTTPKLAEDLNRLSKIPVGRMVEIPLPKKPLHKLVGYIDCTPSPESYVSMLLVIISDSTNLEDRKWAKEELVRAMTIAMGVKKETNER